MLSDFYKSAYGLSRRTPRQLGEAGSLAGLAFGIEVFVARPGTYGLPKSADAYSSRRVRKAEYSS